MSCLYHTEYHGVGRERLPDLLQQRGISVQLLHDSADQLEMRCTRDKVTVRLGVFRGHAGCFRLQAEPEPTGLMFLRWPRALQLAEDLIQFVQMMELTSTQCPHCRAHFSYLTQYPAESCPHCQQPLGTSATSTDTMWYIARGNKKAGPVPWRKLQKLAVAGKVRPGDMVLEETQTGTAPANGRPEKKAWRRASSVAQLFPVAAAATPVAVPVAQFAPETRRPAASPPRAVAVAAPAHIPHSRRIQRAPFWMFALSVLVVAIMGVTTFSLLQGGFPLSESTQLTIALVNLVGIILLGVITVAIEHRTAEPFRTFRGVAGGAFCLGFLNVAISSIYRTLNERGGEIYDLCGPQNYGDVQFLQYGLAMLLVAAVAFLLPNRFTMTFTGLGISLGGVLQLWVAKLALAGEVQLRAATADGMGKLMEQFPVIPLVMGVILLLAGIGWAIGSWFMKPEKGTS
jgi:hypothetical protein